jgi:hypothetical protein
LEVEKGKDGTKQKIGNWGVTVFYEWGGCLGRRYVPAGSDNKIPGVSGRKQLVKATEAHLENPL